MMTFPGDAAPGLVMAPPFRIDPESPLLHRNSVLVGMLQSVIRSIEEAQKGSSGNRRSFATLVATTAFGAGKSRILRDFPVQVFVSSDLLSQAGITWSGPEFQSWLQALRICARIEIRGSIVNFGRNSWFDLDSSGPINFGLPASHASLAFAETQQMETSSRLGSFVSQMRRRFPECVGEDGCLVIWLVADDLQGDLPSYRALRQWSLETSLAKNSTVIILAVACRDLTYTRLLPDLSLSPTGVYPVVLDPLTPDLVHQLVQFHLNGEDWSPQAVSAFSSAVADLTIGIPRYVEELAFYAKQRLRSGKLLAPSWYQQHREPIHPSMAMGYVRCVLESKDPYALRVQCTVKRDLNGLNQMTERGDKGHVLLFLLLASMHKVTLPIDHIVRGLVVSDHARHLPIATTLLPDDQVAYAVAPILFNALEDAFQRVLCVQVRLPLSFLSESGKPLEYAVGAQLRWHSFFGRTIREVLPHCPGEFLGSRIMCQKTELLKSIQHIETSNLCETFMGWDTSSGVLALPRAKSNSEDVYWIQGGPDGQGLVFGFCCKEYYKASFSLKTLILEIPKHIDEFHPRQIHVMVVVCTKYTTSLLRDLEALAHSDFVEYFEGDSFVMKPGVYSYTCPQARGQRWILDTAAAISSSDSDFVRTKKPQTHTKFVIPESMSVILLLPDGLARLLTKAVVTQLRVTNASQTADEVASLDNVLKLVEFTQVSTPVFRRSVPPYLLDWQNKSFEIKTVSGGRNIQTFPVVPSRVVNLATLQLVLPESDDDLAETFNRALLGVDENAIADDQLVDFYVLFGKLEMMDYCYVLCQKAKELTSSDDGMKLKLSDRVFELDLLRSAMDFAARGRSFEGHPNFGVVSASVRDRCSFASAARCLYSKARDGGVGAIVKLTTIDGGEIPVHIEWLVTHSEYFSDSIVLDRVSEQKTLSVDVLSHASLQCYVHWLYHGSVAVLSEDEEEGEVESEGSDVPDFGLLLDLLVFACLHEKGMKSPVWEMIDVRVASESIAGNRAEIVLQLLEKHERIRHLPTVEERWLVEKLSSAAEVPVASLSVVAFMESLRQRLVDE